MYLCPDERSSSLGVTADMGVPVCPECTLDMGVLTKSSALSAHAGRLTEASRTQVAGLRTPSIGLQNRLSVTPHALTQIQMQVAAWEASAGVGGAQDYGRKWLTFVFDVIE